MKSQGINTIIQRIILMTGMILFACAQNYGQTRTIALWKFDESIGLYPSHALDDSSGNDYPLVIGKSARIIKGKFGNALDMTQEYPLETIFTGDTLFGLAKLPIPEGRTSVPMHWGNANFSALMASGEKHLRKQVGFVNPSETKLNLGPFDWTLSFWYKPLRNSTDKGVIFEIGTGPLQEKCSTTSLSVTGDKTGFHWTNDPLSKTIFIPSNQQYLSDASSGDWHHYAFVYNAKKQIVVHYVDGKRISQSQLLIKPIIVSNEAYFSIGRDGFWQDPLPGALDDFEFSEGIKYNGNFNPLSQETEETKVIPTKGIPLLFSKTDNEATLSLGSRKHVFIDGAFLQKLDNSLQFVVNPPKQMERVIEGIKGPFRKHLTVLEDEHGIIRLYNSLENDHLAVFLSKDGIHFEAPRISESKDGSPNIVIPTINGGMGNPFIDPNGPSNERYKYLSNYHRRGVYLYTSPDGLKWERKATAILPFRPGSQSCTFYDEQTQEYVSYHRTDMLQTEGGATLRGSVLVRMKDITKPVDFEQLTYEDYMSAKDSLSLREPQPWFMDNGPLTPGGFGLEFPLRFLPIPEDPVGTDIYVTKAQKYPWAPDTYVSFPIIYFHYNDDGPNTRTALMDPGRLRGEGPLETQLSVSRDGLNWKRYPRPAYVGIGKYLGKDLHTAYLAHGMVRRGDEIWQYYFGETQYHSAYTDEPDGRGVYRLVQRLDGFVSLDSPYGKEAEAVSKPFTFSGKSLYLNVDTDAAGYVQVGFLDQYGKAIEGYSVDDCIYINGDFIEEEVEWINGSDLSLLEGKTVHLVFRMRGSKLYALQFK